MMGIASVPLLFVLATAPPTRGDTPTRSEYLDRVEPICERGTQANETVLRGVDTMIREGKLKRAAARFKRAATALKVVVAKLAVVPRPASDASRLSKWLHYARGGEALLRRIGQLLGSGKRRQAEAMADRLLREIRRANATVIGFDFHYCRLQPGRFV